MSAIPNYSSDLRVSETTTLAEVERFLEARLRAPAVVGGAVVYNFNSHDIDARALLNANLDDGMYVIPYQVAGMWGTMVQLLPQPVAEATLLTYRQGSGEYATYPNHMADLSYEASVESEQPLTEAFAAGIEDLEVWS